MEKGIYFLAVLLALVTMSCSNKQAKPVSISAYSQDTLGAYDEMYRDSFDILIQSRFNKPLTKVDTMYTEMYIALKTMAKDKRSAPMVIRKVDSLVVMDTVKANQVEYLECKQMALASLGRKKEAYKLGYRIFNLYPENSYERLVSLGGYYTTTNQMDSANYYLERSLTVARSFLKSSSEKVQTDGAVCTLTSLIMLGREKKAKSFIKERLYSKTSAEEKEMLEDAERDFDGLKRSLLKPLEEERKVMMADEK